MRDWLIRSQELLRATMLGSIGLLLVIGGLSIVPTKVLSLDSGRDWSANSVMSGGCLTIRECQRKFSQSGVAPMYHWFGISAQDMDRMGSTVRSCQITKANNVKMNGKIIAKKAMTAGRQNMAGSSRVTHRGMTFYVRQPSVSFASSPLSAFCSVKNGRFDWAIIRHCGNAVMATPVRPQAPQKVTQVQKVTKVVKVVQPAPAASATAVAKASANVTVNAPAAPKPTPVAAAAPKTTPSKATGKELPAAGPSDVLSIGVLATVAGSVGHYLYHRRRL